MEDARPGMVRCSIVVEHEVADDEDSAGLQGLLRLAEHCGVVRRALLVRDVRVDDHVIEAIAEVRRVKIAVDRLEAVRDTVVRDEPLADPVHGGPIDLRRCCCLVRPEQDDREDAGAASDVEHRRRCHLREIEALDKRMSHRQRERDDRQHQFLPERVVGDVRRVLELGHSRFRDLREVQERTPERGKDHLGVSAQIGGLSFDQVEACLRRVLVLAVGDLHELQGDHSIEQGLRSAYRDRRRTRDLFDRASPLLDVREQRMCRRRSEGCCRRLFPEACTTRLSPARAVAGSWDSSSPTTSISGARVKNNGENVIKGPQFQQ